MAIRYHADLVQGSDEWLAARRGLLTASEMKLILTPTLKTAANDKERAHLYELLAQRVQTIAEGSVPAEYVLQLQTGLLVSERRWIDFVSYSGGLPMYVHRVLPDADVQDAILAAAHAFEARLTDKLRLFEIGAEGLHPTERRVEQEMFV